MMDRRKIRILIMALLGCLLLAAVALAAPAATTIDRWVIGGGGGSVENAGASLDGTIGQPLVGGMQAGIYELGSGYWGALGPTGIRAFQVYLPTILRSYAP